MIYWLFGSFRLVVYLRFLFWFLCLNYVVGLRFAGNWRDQSRWGSFFVRVSEVGWAFVFSAVKAVPCPVSFYVELGLVAGWTDAH